LVLFSKKYREKELKKNTSEQLRLGTAVEFDDERKRVFGWRGYQTPSASLVPLPKEGQYSSALSVFTFNFSAFIAERVRDHHTNKKTTLRAGVFSCT
jgi:hypothetical protein